MKFLMTLLFITSFSLQANECLELGKCIEHISKLTGKKYLYDAREIKGGLQSSSNTEINSENADNLLTYILDLNGYARIPTIEKDTYIIINSRDLRYQSSPSIEVDSQTAPKIPANFDTYMMTFKFKNYDQGQLREASNSLRPFMSRYARVIESKGPGLLLIQENAAHLVRAYEIIKSFDRKLTKEEIKDKKQREADYKQERKLKLLHCKSDDNEEGPKEEKKEEKKK